MKVLDELTEQYKRIKQLPKDKLEVERHSWFEKYDSHLDEVLCGEMHLKKEEVADLVADAIHFRDGKVYDLLAFTIMPNHAHLVCTPLEMDRGTYFSLTEILHSLKRYTARQSNLILKKSGAFWQDESYDHIVRNEAELERIIKYVLYNPVKAKLVREQKDWKWSYCKYNF